MRGTLKEENDAALLDPIIRKSQSSETDALNMVPPDPLQIVCLLWNSARQLCPRILRMNNNRPQPSDTSIP